MARTIGRTIPAENCVECNTVIPEHRCTCTHEDRAQAIPCTCDLALCEACWQDFCDSQG